MSEKTSQHTRRGPGPKSGLTGFDGLAAAILIQGWTDLNGQGGTRWQEDARQFWGGEWWSVLVDGLNLEPGNLPQRSF